MKEKLQYKKLFQDVRKIINEIDPEDLSPGQVDGSPVDEYDQEVQLIVNFIIHNQEEIKLDKQALINQINEIWRERFGDDCCSGDIIVDRLCKIIF